MNNQAQGPWKTLVLNNCILVIYVPLRLERSESVPKLVFIRTFKDTFYNYLNVPYYNAPDILATQKYQPEKHQRFWMPVQQIPVYRQSIFVLPQDEDC